jgi:hypothetical protein
MPPGGLQILRLAPGWQLACIWLWGSFGVALPAFHHSSFILRLKVQGSTFTISLQNATSLPRLPGVAWGRSGQTLDILWYHRTPSNPRFRSATLIPLNHGGCVLPAPMVLCRWFLGAAPARTRSGSGNNLSLLHLRRGFRFFAASGGRGGAAPPAVHTAIAPP